MPIKRFEQRQESGSFFLDLFLVCANIQAGREEFFMQVIVRIKEGLWGNLACIAFLLGLSAGTMWLSVHCGHGYSPLAFFFCAAWVAGCYFPISNIRHPSNRVLGIEGNYLVWTIKEESSEKVQEDRVPLHLIKTITLVLPQIQGEPNTRSYTGAQLYIRTSQGHSSEIPTDFRPGVYWQQIVAAVKERVSTVQVLEQVGDGTPVPVTPVTAREKTKVTVLLWLLGIVFVVFSATVTVLTVQRVWIGYQTRSWIPTTAILRQVTHERSGDATQTKVLYTYRIGDQSFTGSRIGYRLSDSADELAEGQTITLFYNPKSPSEAVIFPGTGLLDIVVILIAFIPGCLVVFVLVLFTKYQSFRDQLCWALSQSSKPCRRKW